VGDDRPLRGGRLVTYRFAFPMFDIFTEEIELTIKNGIANLYWYLGDLKKAWLRAGVDRGICDSLFSRRQADGSKFTKRQLMDML
jgi:hypothetical protein